MQFLRRLSGGELSAAETVQELHGQMLLGHSDLSRGTIVR